MPSKPRMEYLQIEADETCFEKLRIERQISSSIELKASVREQESHVPAFCEMLVFPTRGRHNGYGHLPRQANTKKILEWHGIKMPHSQSSSRKTNRRPKAQYPIILKPSHEGSSMGSTSITSSTTRSSSKEAQGDATHLQTRNTRRGVHRWARIQRGIVGNFIATRSPSSTIFEMDFSKFAPESALSWAKG